MITTIKTHSSKLMMLSILFFISAFMSNSYGTTLPDSTKSCSTDKKFAVSKADSTHKDMKMGDMGGGMHKEMMAKKDSTSSCKNKEGMQESPSGKEMAMADCKMRESVPSGKDGEKKDCKMKDEEKKECKMREEEKKDCKMKEAETKEGKGEHESHHKGESEKSVN